MDNNIEIKAAIENDIPLILTFIKELAEYEKLLDQVVADEDILRASLFGPEKTAEVILAYQQGEPVGFALFFYNFSTFLGRPGIYLEDLYIRPAYRSKGYGKHLLSYLAKMAVDGNKGRLEWWVLNWNEKAKSFYESVGAKPMDEWTVYRVEGESLAQLAGD